MSWVDLLADPGKGDVGVARREHDRTGARRCGDTNLRSRLLVDLRYLRHGLLAPIHDVDRERGCGGHWKDGGGESPEPLAARRPEGDDVDRRGQDIVRCGVR